jgi:hypothetical protein
VPYYPCDTTLSTPEINSPEVNNSCSINNVYPNPASDNLTIDYSVSYNGNVNVVLYDMLGRAVYKENSTSKAKGSYKVYLNISNLAKGSYFVRIETEKETAQKKFLIIR